MCISPMEGQTMAKERKTALLDEDGVVLPPLPPLLPTNPRDPRRYGVVEVRRRSVSIYRLTIAGQLWASVEWSPRRRRWCIEDGINRCLAHVEHIHGEDPGPQAAIRFAKQMIRDGRMPTPEEARAALHRGHEEATEEN
jgi:hypothetical protein